MKTYKCPYCGETSVWHTQTPCFRTRLKRLEEKCAILAHALGEIRLETVLDDDLSDDSRNASLEYIDAALNGEPL
jgi:hypothetical protein